MNAWTIYWVMQLDSIRVMFFVLASIAAVASAISFLAFLDDDCKWFVPFATTSLAALLFMTNGFLPSSKTAAAMVILPAIANNEQVQKEAGDLYGLAKQALTNLAKPEEKSK